MESFLSFNFSTLQCPIPSRILEISHHVFVSELLFYLPLIIFPHKATVGGWWESNLFIFTQSYRLRG